MGWRSGTDLRLKQAREIDTTQGTFHKIERKNGDAILAPGVNSELRHASPRIEALSSRTALRRKQPREIDVEPGPFSIFKRKNGDAILAPGANSEPWQARLTRCFDVNCSPGVQEADRNSSQTVHRECRRSRILTMWTLTVPIDFN